MFWLEERGFEMKLKYICGVFAGVIVLFSSGHDAARGCE
jgi:hypothetical protein